MVAEYVQTDSSSPVAGIRSYFFFSMIIMSFINVCYVNMHIKNTAFNEIEE